MSPKGGQIMPTFGENLRRERELRGVSLAEISDATKISVRSLAALEADEFDKLPGGIFTRSFLRAYAKYIGLDEEVVMAEFQLVAPKTDQADLARMNQQRPPRSAKSSHGRLIGLLAAMLLVLIGYGVYRYSHHLPILKSVSHPAATAQPNTPAAPPAATTAPAETTPAATVQPGVDAAGTTPAAAQPAPSSDSPLVLQIAATERSWVAVDSDGKPVSQRIMEPNEIQTFRAKTSFDVITGNGEGVILTLNGKTLDPLGHGNDVKKVHLTLSDVQNQNP